VVGSTLIKSVLELLAVTPQPSTTVEASVNGGEGISLGGLITGAVVAAAIGAVVTVYLALRKSREEERARVRSTLAEAFQAYAEYKEFPYAVRRRRADQPAAERVRLSEAMREVQAHLSYYEAWTLAESKATGEAYGTLVRMMRQIAGTAIHDAWNTPPILDDRGMNLGPDIVDLSELKQYEEAFMRAADAHVAGLVAHWWSRRR
jgi:hypothetical protein